MVRVARLSIAPVRSLGLEHPNSIELTADGVAEDRRFYIIDEEGRFLDRIRVGRLVRVRAQTDPLATRLRLTFPDGLVVDDAVRLGATVETAIFSRTALGRVVEGPWAPAISSFAGRPVRLVRCERPGGTRSRPGEPHATNTVSLVSDGSLRRLAGALGVEAVDARRFRMLIELQGAEPHEEDDWIGRQVRVGSAVLSITKPDARCAITTQDPDTGARDLDTLRALIGYRGLRDRRKVDFGVLGEVAVPGRLSVGDEVMVETSPPT